MSKKAVCLSLVLFVGTALSQNTLDHAGTSSHNSQAITHHRLQIMPLDEIKPGMVGVGKTVFSGERIQEFRVKVLGVVRNMGPRQSVILADLSGGPLADTGVLQGMSGSPVYIDGKLVGAVALGFPFSKSALAGITPIEEMIAQQKRADSISHAEVGPQRVLQLTAANGTLEILDPHPGDLLKVPQAPPSNTSLSNFNLPELHTPLVLSGFSARTVQHFMPEFQSLGLEPMLGGVGGGGDEYRKQGNPSDLHPGDMISVQLVRGDLSVSADGTVTYIDGNHVYAFGHRFLAAGEAAFPFSKSSVLALMPGYMTSFKISQPGESLGVIRQDLSQGIYGTFGGKAPMIPVRMTMHTPDGASEAYRFEIADNRFLSPFLLKLAAFSTLDATQRSLGPQTLALRGAIHLSGAPDIRVQDLFSGDVNGPDAASTTAATPLAYLYSSGLTSIHVNGIDLDVFSSNDKRVLRLQQVWCDHREVRPGDRLEVTAVLRAVDGTEVAKHLSVVLPASVSPGPLHVVVGEGNAFNALEMQQLQQGFEARELPQLVRAINHIRRNNLLYLRVMRPDTAYVLDGEQLPSPPPSLARALADDASVDSNVSPLHSSPLADAQSEPLPFVISGVKSITVNVKDN
jgi:hypothetical protein